MKKYFVLLMVLFSSTASLAMENDDPLLTKLMIEQFEVRNAKGDNPTVFEGEFWIGKDLNKLWFKVDAESVGGKTEEAEYQALYSRAIAPYWDVQVGLRHDQRPTPTRNWGVIGLKGVAPYLFEVDTALFIGDNNRTGFRLQAEYEFMITQKWILSPEVETNFYGKTDSETKVGSGLSDLSFGLRLRYEIKRHVAPYVGVYWFKKFGDTANFARADGEEISDTQFVVGIRAWF